ncbi:Asp23/Gls24 family envelope stress response protein [Natranaerobius trueperi]|uniref:Asp23/Gls24 family envelope stress response protein n=1 Tax=Natranaerobius trueperi TaxID=759412 RepID=A0A226BZ21_9FIRM|nr:Asp23/Gls24 family envelope stress response protein [Natranaerobius trueperi]OWZ84175.1 Asp23/Gls24 family envelope stress response protein [Natranaerobius trueperi]
MNGNVIENQYGQIHVSESVIATIAGTSAIECYGLVGMASRRLKDGINELLKKEDLSRGVQILNNEGKLSIELYIIVSYGTQISVVANNVMEKVKYTVEYFTGLEVEEVNINVQGVRVQE